MFIKHMKNKLFFAKFLATPRLFVYEQKVVAPVLGNEFRLLDQVQSGGIHHGQEAEEDQGHLSYVPRSAASHNRGRDRFGGKRTSGCPREKGVGLRPALLLCGGWLLRKTTASDDHAPRKITCLTRSPVTVHRSRHELVDDALGDVAERRLRRRLHAIQYKKGAGDAAMCGDHRIAGDTVVPFAHAQ
jgi:hypothetical protein